METLPTNPNQNPSQEEKSNENLELFLGDLPRIRSWDGRDYYQYQGHWCPYGFIHGVLSFQKHFQARDNDVILSSFPKSGTTWLKALLFSIMNRTRFALERNPILTRNPHELVPTLEIDLYKKDISSPNLEEFPMPRLFSTHVPYAWLPHSILNNNCRIVYVCRNPLDQFVSHWHFSSGVHKHKMLPVEEAFDMVCDGVQPFGPFWEHALGYWKAKGKEKDKILFLKYEDLKENINFHVRKLAEFLGYPFSEDEENQGVVENISKLCSFDNMKDLEVNKTGKFHHMFSNNIYFRTGQVGDWKNYITSSMSERLKKIIEEKLDGSGLSFKQELDIEEEVK